MMAIEEKTSLPSAQVASFYCRICSELDLSNRQAIKPGKMLSNSRENR